MARDGGIMMYHGDSTYPNGHGQRLEIIDEPLDELDLHPLTPWILYGNWSVATIKPQIPDIRGHLPTTQNCVSIVCPSFLQFS